MDGTPLYTVMSNEMKHPGLKKLLLFIQLVVIQLRDFSFRRSDVGADRVLTRIDFRYIVKPKFNTIIDFLYMVKVKFNTIMDFRYIVKPKFNAIIDFRHIVKPKFNAISDFRHIVKPKFNAISDSRYIIKLRFNAIRDLRYIVKPFLILAKAYCRNLRSACAALE
jgi:hypothetical protein